MSTIIILNQGSNNESYYKITNDIDYSRKGGAIFHKKTWIKMVASNPTDVETLESMPGNMFKIISVTKSKSLTNTSYYSVVEFTIEGVDYS